MAVYIPEQDILFLHIPKCGGAWVETAIRNLRPTGIKARHYPLERDRTTAYIHKHLTLDQWVQAYGNRPKYVFTFVRDPKTWYESFFRYQWQRETWNDYSQYRWHPLQPIGACGSRDFSEFVSNSLDTNGSFVTRLYEWYAGPPGSQIICGRLEYGAKALIGCLQLCGMALTKEQQYLIQNTLPQHETPSPRISEEWKADWYFNTLDRMKEIEVAAYIRFFQQESHV